MSYAIIRSDFRPEDGLVDPIPEILEVDHVIYLPFSGVIFLGEMAREEIDRWHDEIHKVLEVRDAVVCKKIK